MEIKNLRSKIVTTRERNIVKRFLNFLLQTNSSLETVLDVPVGTGKMTDILLRYNLKVTSGDVLEEMMEFIDGDFKNHPNYVEEKVIDASSLSFDNERFDLSLNIRLIHRVDSETRLKILKEAYRVTKSYYIVSFAIDNFWNNIRLKFKKRDPSLGRLKWKKLKGELKKVGFTIIKRKSTFPIFRTRLFFY